MIPQDSTIVIFGVFINAVERLREPSSFPLGMDFSNVEELLKSSGVEISENAQKCKNFLQMAMGGANVAKNAPRSTSSTQNPPSTSPSSDVQAFLDQRLKSLEENLTRKIDKKLEEMEKRQNEKLEEILKEIQCLQMNK